MKKQLASLFLFCSGALCAAEFTLSSPDLQNDGVMPIAQVQCGGQNRSPALSWHNAPAGTKSFAVTAYDPDAPTGSGWWQWQIYNIPATITELASNAGDPASSLAPAGSVQNVNDGGKPGYAGACPPKGDQPHRYVFTVYAMPDEIIKAPATASNAMIGFNLVRKSLGKATLTVRYGRQ
jgi:Raf kinase inhibitor-like YbhB/YbcL family protein